MGKLKRQGDGLSIELFVNTPSGPAPLEGGIADLPLPIDPIFNSPRITYGQYLRSIARHLSSYSFRAVREVLARRPEPAPPLRSAESITLTSEKHGVLYSVSRLSVTFPQMACNFAVNAAILPEQQVFLLQEYRLVRELYHKFRRPYLPRPFLSGKTELAHSSSNLTVRFFMAEWFEGYHEFHLKPLEDGHSAGCLGVNVWNRGARPCFLDAGQTGELYELAARILTAYLDTQSFRQIYPWHHAAGDFVIDEVRKPVGVRLITARGYRSLLRDKAAADDKILGSLHFFLNMSIRMRIDRLDGTGDLAWADAKECVQGIVRGFVVAWEIKAQENPELPEALEIFQLFLQLSFEERLAFAEVAAQDGRVEEGEDDLIAQHLPVHLRELTAAVEEAIQPAT